VRAHPVDVVDPDGITRYGWSGAVPESPATDEGAGPITVVLRALPKVDATDSLVARLTGGGTRPGSVLVVAGEDRPDPTGHGRRPDARRRGPGHLARGRTATRRGWDRGRG
jgi:hypothetical protein